MANSKNVTATKGRLSEVIDEVVNKSANPRIEEKITKVADQLIAHTGVVTKVYPYIDKVEVDLDSKNKKILCKTLHRYGGDLLDLYTPLAEKRIFCDKLKEPCYIPRLKLHCVVLSINDKDSKEHLILGYYQNDDIEGLSIPKPGNMKLASTNDINQFWISFGRNGLDLRLPSDLSSKVGGLSENMEDRDYDNDSLYSKKEVDAMFKEYETKLKTYEDRIKALEESLNPTDNTEDTEGSENNNSEGGS